MTYNVFGGTLKLAQSNHVRMLREPVVWKNCPVLC